MSQVSQRWWVRGLLGASRGVRLAARLSEAVRDEVLTARLSVAEQEAMTLERYATSTTYAPGGSLFEAGLFDWERQALEHPRWPRAGRVLVGAAGAGREALALARRGHRVTAFEPCAPLAAQGRALAPAGVDFVAAGYEALTAPDRAPGWWPPDDPPVGVVLGWGSLSHVLDPGQRLALLAATRRLAPDAPVLVSFLLAGSRGSLDRRLRHALRRALGSSTEGRFFSPEAGFACLLDLDAITALAGAAGYEVILGRLEPYGHALLAPRPG